MRFGLLLLLIFWLFLLMGATLSGCRSAYLEVPEDPIKALAADDPVVIALAAYAISEKTEKAARDPSVLKTLCKLLRHRDPLVRSAAARALRRITGFDAGYMPFSDPYAQAESINQWESWSERMIGGSK